MPRDAFLALVRRELSRALEERDEAAILLPRSATEVGWLVRTALELGAELAAPGDAQASARGIPIDLRRMTDVVAFDHTSHLVHVQGGVSVASLERELRRRELTLALRGTPSEEPLGAWLARGAPGGRDHADDPVDQLVAGLELVLPDGTLLDIHPAPRRAVGPDLIGAMLAGGTGLGIVTAAHLVAHRLAPRTELAFLFPSKTDAETALAWIRGRGARPAGAVVATTPEGGGLRVTFSGPSQLVASFVDVARRTAAERRGAEVEPGEVAASTGRALPSATSEPIAELVSRIAARIPRRTTA